MGNPTQTYSVMHMLCSKPGFDAAVLSHQVLQLVLQVFMVSFLLIHLHGILSSG